MAAKVAKRDEGVIDPKEHLGLAFGGADRAARRFGGVREDWLGDAYIALTGAARTFDPDRGATFATYATRCVDFQMIIAVHRRCGYQYRRLVPNGKQKWVRLPTVELGREQAPRVPEMGSPVELPELSEREEHMVRLRRLGVTLEVIGEDVGLSKERVRQCLNEIRERCLCA